MDDGRVVNKEGPNEFRFSPIDEDWKGGSTSCYFETFEQWSAEELPYGSGGYVSLPQYFWEVGGGRGV